jgi:hypothetical protein
MVKTNTPAQFKLAGRIIHTNALPDPFDENDLEYRPRLGVLPIRIDQRAGQPIRAQSGQSCTGHAVAALIDTVLSEPVPENLKGKPGVRRTKKGDGVSPYMLYAMARKYDEYPGTADVGSSLRGAFKGWYKHGVCQRADWPRLKSEAPEINDPDFMARCFQTPLGAYYRVKTRRIDDLQSAITELNAVAVSAAVHEGWINPKPQGEAGKEIWVIDRKDDDASLGGHAFLIAGYNEVGFLVQNSWGLGWGHGGYATLPYEDWLDNAYDAWVARPGVPQSRFVPNRRVIVPAGAIIAATAGPNLARLKDYVIDVTAGGRMDTKGQVTSNPEQIKSMARTMGSQLDRWATPAEGGHRRRIVFYAHGGLVAEAGGVAIADRQIDWWKDNHIYPIHIVWESDAIRTIVSFLDGVVEKLPFGGLLDGFWEAVDQKIETLGRNIQMLWAEMKENAYLASAPRAGTSELNAPGVTLFLQQLKGYQAIHEDLEVHLVAHSAGSLVVAGTIERLIAMGIPVESVQLMGGAISVQEFEAHVLKHIVGVPNSTGMLKRFTSYDLKDKFELDDVCPGPPFPAVYHKSLLYFVARSLEPAPTQHEKPMVGLENGFKARVLKGSRSLLDVVGGDNFVRAPTDGTASANARSQAHGHADFDDDEETLTSVVMRILGTTSLGDVKQYKKGGQPSTQTALPPPTVGHEVKTIEPVQEEVAVRV